MSSDQQGNPGRLADAYRAIRYLRSKCAGIAHLGHGEEAAREALTVTGQWDFLDHMEPEEAASVLSSAIRSDA